jgi:DNA repair protein RadD
MEGGIALRYSLRPYQQAAVDAVYEHLRERDDNPCVVLPTGTGKSLVLGQIATDAVSRWGGRVLVLAHVKELLEQNAEKIQALCGDLDVGVYSAGLKRRDTDHSVIVAGIQSVYRRACELGSFDLVIVDELCKAQHNSSYVEYIIM